MRSRADEVMRILDTEEVDAQSHTEVKEIEAPAQPTKDEYSPGKMEWDVGLGQGGRLGLGLGKRRSAVSGCGSMPKIPVSHPGKQVHTAS